MMTYYRIIDQRFAKQSDILQEETIFNEILRIDVKDMGLGKQMKSIKDDIKRTVKDDPYYQPKNKGFKKMYEVLKAFTLYDKNCGYVQGMNFIVAPLVYH
jgi:hypothetical protein